MPKGVCIFLWVTFLQTADIDGRFALLILKSLLYIHVVVKQMV